MLNIFWYTLIKHKSDSIHRTVTVYRIKDKYYNNLAILNLYINAIQNARPSRKLTFITVKFWKIWRTATRLVMKTERNPFCPHYDRCLADHAFKNHPGWSCAGCEYEKQTISTEFFDLEGSWLLLWALFEPAKYKAFRDYQTQKRLNDC